MISINNLSHYLGGKLVLSNVSLQVPDGTIMGLVGINGAGKSTLLRLLSGVYFAKSGNIEFDGNSPENEETRKDIFFLPDDPYFTNTSTIKSVLNMYKEFYPTLSMDTYNSLIATFKLDENKPIRSFSKGMRRQAYIAIAIAIKPKYLLLDEAFDGLDPLARKIVKDEITKMATENNSTVIISSHSLRELDDFCHMYAIIDDKSVSSSGDITEKNNKYCKFMLAFSDSVPNDIFKDLPLVSLSQTERFVTGVFEGDENEIRELLLKFKPAVIEQIPVDFEEAFISEVSKKWQALRGIFLINLKNHFHDL